MSDDLLDAIHALGSTEEQIAASLAAAGMKGTPRVASCCVLANYLKTIWPKRRIRVDAGVIEVDGFDFVWPDKELADFIEGFDHRDYPDLIKET